MWVFRRSLIDKLDLHSDGWTFSNELKLESYFTEPDKYAEFMIPYEERVGPTHNVTIWKTGLQVLGFMAHARFNHFMRARVSKTRDAFAGTESGRRPERANDKHEV
jgi:hypothetical protein